MADQTHIEWTDATWNPITGCSVVSPGCTNCYAMQLAGTRLKRHESRAGLTREVNGNHVWTGEVRLNEAWLTQPLTWSKPRRIFVCAHGDLFHESVPDEWIDKVFAVMALAPQHTFQVLTKRPERMREYFTKPVIGNPVTAKRSHVIWQTMYGAVRTIQQGHILDSWYGGPTNKQWPLPNVWLGVSVEDQVRAEARIPHLLRTPAAIRFVSAEPLLGAVYLQLWLRPRVQHARDCAYVVCDGPAPCTCGSYDCIDWVIAGGENGPRPMHPAWARNLRDDCTKAKVPFFFKQWGSWQPIPTWEPWRNLPMMAMDINSSVVPHDINPDNVDGQRFIRVGKKAAGDLLDGVRHHAMPEVRL